ncbi:hypothetical protein [Streptomyces sp. NPDC048611]|uniref:hypothetical protein n=1 Tax=Streptomyces sp. NPDC048611 TaxID=3155635 RepID=UPI0034489CAD
MTDDSLREQMEADLRQAQDDYDPECNYPSIESIQDMERALYGHASGETPEAGLRQRIAEVIGPWVSPQDAESVIGALEGVFQRETVRLRTEAGNAKRSRDYWYQRGREAIRARRNGEQQ